MAPVGGATSEKVLPGGTFTVEIEPGDDGPGGGERGG
jgi:hypothetical protein